MAEQASSNIVVGTQLAPDVPASPPPRVGDVLKVAARHFGTTPEALTSPRRTQPATRQRQIVMFVARKMTGRSLPLIARRVGRKDHTTILHGVRAVQARLDAGDVKTAAAVQAIASKLQGGANV
jgi:chromosomal replication initiator protein